MTFEEGALAAQRASRLLAILALAGCGGATPHRFPVRDPLWIDDDQSAFAPRPADQYNAFAADAADNTVFRPLGELFRYEEAREAIDVNSLDEVPSSSWFENRVGRTPMSIEAVAEGACGGSPVPEPPWTIHQLKSAGETPGFVLDAGGHRYLFKTDIRVPELTTAADAIATRIFHAIGYATPCNHVVFYTPDFFRIASDATRDDDDHTPLTEADVREVLASALVASDGRLRGSLSQYIDGAPLGGWRFEGRRDDDPNDVVPHQHRRELRAMEVAAAWVNHIDARAGSNFDAWVSTDGTHGYVRHYVLDVGDSFGLVFDGSDELMRRFGHSYYFDAEQIVVDLFSLGLVDRPYREHDGERVHPVFTYYDTEHFTPDEWHSGYPLPAFERRTEHDAAWMARILSQISADHLRAMVATGMFSDPSVAGDLVRILRGRQRLILERYLTRLSPLAFPEVVAERGRSWLCLRDLAIEAGIRSQPTREYRITASVDWPDGGDPIELEHGRADGRVCAVLPEIERASARSPRYLVVDVVAGTPERETTGAASVHLYQTGPSRYRIVGLRRAEPS